MKTTKRMIRLPYEYYASSELTFKFITLFPEDNERSRVFIEESLLKKWESDEKTISDLLLELFKREKKIFNFWIVAEKHYFIWSRDANNGRFVHKYHHCWDCREGCRRAVAEIEISITEDSITFKDHLFHIVHNLKDDSVQIQIVDGSWHPLTHLTTISSWNKTANYSDLNAETIINEYESFLATPVKRVDHPVHPLDMYPDEKEYIPLEKYLRELEYPIWKLNKPTTILYDLARADEEIIRLEIVIDGNCVFNKEFKFREFNRPMVHQVLHELNLEPDD